MEHLEDLDFGEDIAMKSITYDMQSKIDDVNLLSKWLCLTIIVG